MIANTQLGYIYSGAPKTATGSFRTWLAGHYGGKEVSATRGALIPDGEYRSKCRPIVSVQNPYVRCIQMWWHASMAMERDPKCHLAGCSFYKYMHRLIWHRDHVDNNHQNPDVYFQMSYYHDELKKQTGKDPVVIRVENYKEDLPKLWFYRPETLSSFTVEKQFPSYPTEATPQKFLSGAEEEMVWEYCREDFAMFNYPRLPRHPGTQRNWGHG